MADPHDLTGGAPQGEGGEKKIFVDTDWKAQAQAEKEKLAAEEARRASEEQGQSGAERVPQADFRAMLGSLATQALLYLGGIPDPETGRAIVGLDYARHYIDLLAVLEEKTKGNLTDDEAKELTEILQELRQRFVQISQAMLQAAEAGELDFDPRKGGVIGGPPAAPPASERGPAMGGGPGGGISGPGMGGPGMGGPAGA